ARFLEHEPDELSAPLDRRPIEELVRGLVGHARRFSPRTRRVNGSHPATRRRPREARAGGGAPASASGEAVHEVLLVEIALTVFDRALLEAEALEAERAVQLARSRLAGRHRQLHELDVADRAQMR